MQEFLHTKRRLLGTKSWWETFQEDYFSQFDHESCLCCKTLGAGNLQEQFDSLRVLDKTLTNKMHKKITPEHSVHSLRAEECRQKHLHLMNDIKSMMQRYDSLLVYPICSSCKTVMMEMINFPFLYNHFSRPCETCFEFKLVEAIAVVIPVNDIPELIFEYLAKPEPETGFGNVAIGYATLIYHANVAYGANVFTTTNGNVAIGSNVLI